MIIDKDIPFGILEVLKEIAKKNNRDINDVITEYKKILEEREEESKKYFLVKVLRNNPYIKIKVGDVLIFSFNYTLKDKGIYCIRYQENDFIGIYHEKTKKFFISDDIISFSLKNVDIIGELKSRYQEYEL